MDDSLQAPHNNSEDGDNMIMDSIAPTTATTGTGDAGSIAAAADTMTTTTSSTATPDTESGPPLVDVKEESIASENVSDNDLIDSPKFTIVSEADDDEDEDTPHKKRKHLSSLTTGANQPDNDLMDSPKFTKVSEDDDEDSPHKKRKHLLSLTSRANQPQLPITAEQSAFEAAASTLAQPTAKRMTTTTATPTTKKSKKKTNNVWAYPTSRKGKKKNKSNNHHNAQAEETVLITPVPRFPDKTDDTPDMNICLSKAYNEKVELSDDRLTAASTKGYRMVRATRGVVEGAWYFEIKVNRLGETGHTRLGWSTEKGDLQAPVGYDANSFGYRDIDGSKIHKALREKYGEKGYGEGDILGFYINLPEGNMYTPKPPHFAWYKGQKYVCAPEGKEDPPKIVPGSEISFFKNGICQGVAFQDLYGGRYYPAASMYTLPNQPTCVVKFNFGPDFEFFPEDFVGRPIPQPMIEVPYHGFDGKVDNGNPCVSIRMCPVLIKEQGTEVMEAADVAS